MQFEEFETTQSYSVEFFRLEKNLLCGWKRLEFVSL